jgi:hypothetical protein
LLSTALNFNSPSALPNVRGPWAFFTLLYLKFHSRTFLQTLKVYLLKTVAVKENLLSIRGANETKAPIPNDTFDCSLHGHLDYVRSS